MLVNGFYYFSRSMFNKAKLHFLIDANNRQTHLYANHAQIQTIHHLFLGLIVWNHFRVIGFIPRIVFGC